LTWASERIRRNDGTITRRVNAILDAAEAAAGINPGLVYVVQGSWSNSSASAGTHSGGGAFDLRVRNLPSARVPPLVVELRRRCGGPVWLRDQQHGGFDPHIHGIVRDELDLSWAAQMQVLSYDAGHNGLANNGPDYHPRPKWVRFPFTPPEDLDMTPAEMLGAKVPSTDKRLNGWTLGHLIEWQGRMALAQRDATAGVVKALAALAAGQQVAQADLDDIQATLAEPEPEPAEPQP